jgi:hypothetical protein
MREREQPQALLRHQQQVLERQRVQPQEQEPLRAQVQGQEREQAPLRGPGPGQLLPSCRRQTVRRQRPGKPTGAMFSLIPLRDFCR